MKTVILIILNLVLLMPIAMSQESKSGESKSKESKSEESNKFKFSFGFNAGVGQNKNGYRQNPDKYDFTYYEGGTHFTSGINTSIFVTNRIRPRLEFRYSEMKYGFNWSDTYPQFDRTEIKLNTLNLNLNLDFLVIDKTKFQLFLSPGIVTEYVVGKSNKNYLVDGTSNSNNYSLITDQYPSSIAGANFSVLAKYNFNENFGITMAPGYNYYFSSFVTGNEEHFTRSLLNLGLEYTF